MPPQDRLLWLSPPTLPANFSTLRIVCLAVFPLTPSTPPRDLLHPWERPSWPELPLTRWLQIPPAAFSMLQIIFPMTFLFTPSMRRTARCPSSASPFLQAPLPAVSPSSQAAAFSISPALPRIPRRPFKSILRLVHLPSWLACSQSRIQP